jgi:hypothetical protein
MKLTEVTSYASAYLIEGLDESSAKSVGLWESAGKRLVELKLSADQIDKLFTDVEQGATAAGGNRTAIGQGKDATMAVKKAWEDLKTKMSDSKPVEGFDQKMSDMLSKIGMGAKDPKFNGEVSGWVKKYRKFAEEHPMAQGAIYATLIALAGLTGAGLAGAAVLGLLKLADKVLQGERFSSAAYAGLKTGVTAFAASKLGDLLKGVKPGMKVPDVGGGKLPPGVPKMDFDKFDYYLGAHNNVVSVAKGAANPFTSSYQPTGTAISEGQLFMLFNRIERRQQMISEGPLDVIKGVGDKVKGAAGRVGGAIANKASTIGKNITTKVTADKLKSAWKKAGSPTDSEEIANVLRSAGVNDDVIAPVYKSMSIPAPSASADPAADTQDPNAEKPGFQQDAVDKIKAKAAANPAAEPEAGAEPGATPDPNAKPKYAGPAGEPAAGAEDQDLEIKMQDLIAKIKKNNMQAEVLAMLK